MATELEELINYYRNNLFYHRHEMMPSVIYLTELTIKNLEKLQKLEEV